MLGDAPELGDALVVEGLSKTFPGTRALRDVSLVVGRGEVHALLGMNGSGKSTLVKVLAGFHQPDPGGRVLVGGVELRFGDPEAPRELGLHFVHQELALLPSLSTVENLAAEYGYSVGRFGPISWKVEARRAREVMEAFGYGIDVRKPVASLSASERAGVAIARAFSGSSGGTRVIVLDEPTAAMPGEEIGPFFERIRRVRERGAAVIYITHHLSEVFRIADSVSVLRDGQLVGSFAVAGLSHEDLVDAIVGRKLAAVERTLRPPEAVVGAALLEVEGLSGGLVGSLSLAVGRGEIVGVAGVDGSGREHVCQLVFGAIARRGVVRVDGREVVGRPDAALRAGMGLVPADRRGDALFPEMPVRENVTMGAIRQFFRGGFLRRGPERGDARLWIERLQVKTPSVETPIALLSGGNQQKVVFARALRRKPPVLLLDEPTQGVDVSAKADIYQLIVDAAQTGAVLVASADSEELALICTRVIVLAGGEVLGTLAGAEISQEAIDRLALTKPAEATAAESTSGVGEAAGGEGT
jgi:ribose transport system ATP-binding protein